MKYTDLKNGPQLIINPNRNLILNLNETKNFSPRFPNNISSISSPTNDTNNNKSHNNISITTNISLKRNNSNISSVKFPIIYSPSHFNNEKNFLFKKRLYKSESTGKMSPKFKYSMEILENADEIIKDRIKNKEIIKLRNKKLAKNIALKQSKDISLKNYIIGLLQQKRIQINENDRVMNQALKEFSKQYENDYRAFIDYVEDVKKKAKEEEDKINNLKKSREKKELILKDLNLEYKKLDEHLEKRIKKIYILKAYGSFVHKVFGIKFNYDSLPDIGSRERNYELIEDLLIKKYNNKDQYEELPKILENPNSLFQKIEQLEESINQMSNNKYILDKENKMLESEYISELSILKKNLEEYKNDFENINRKKNIQEKIKSCYNIEESNNDIELSMSFIFELGKDIGINYSKKSKISNIKEYLEYCEKVLKTMQNFEETINNYINEIENILINGDEESKQLIQKCIIKKKRINKNENQLRIKMMQEAKINEKNMRYMNRAQRLVITGRKVGAIFPKIRKIKIHKYQKSEEKKKKGDDSIDIVYSVSDDEKE